MTSTRRECLNGGGVCDPATLQEAIYCCIHHSKLAPRQIAEQLGISLSYLLDAANPEREQHQFQANRLLPLMAITDNLAPLRFMNAALGRIDIPLPSVVVEGDDVVVAYLRLVREVGEDSGLIEKVLADGHVTRAEALRVKRETRETAEAALHIAALVEHRVEESPRLRSAERPKGRRR